MKKFFIWVVSTILILLTIIYILVNSSFVFEYIAKKFAPQYGFGYKHIGGNPLSGIKIDDLYYKNRLLSDEIILHINPYLFLRGNIGISKLDLSGVDVNILQKIIKDFSKPNKNKEIEEDSDNSSSLPVGFEIDNIHLSLKPFSMVGLDIYKENLNIDSIVFDGDRFIVGNLKQDAKTSLGNVKLRGSYHKRVLNLSLLQINELRVEELTNFISNLSSAENSEDKKEHKDKQSSEENIFIPTKIVTDKLIFKMLPYKVSGIDFYAVVLNGNSIDIDLKKMIFDKAKLTLKTQSNIGNVILQMDCIDDECIANDLDIRRVNIQNILDIAKNSAKDKKEKDSNKSKTIIADIPFVPNIVDIKHAKVALLSQKIKGIDYDNAKINVKDLAIDLRREFVTVDKLNTHIDTNLGSSDADIFIDRDEIVVNNLDINSIDINQIISLANAKKSQEETNNTKQSKKGASVIDIPYLPERVVLNSADISTTAYKSKDINIDKASLNIKNTVADISKMSLENGIANLFVSTDMADININSILQDNGVLIDADKSKITLKDNLMKRYKIPLKANNISPIRLAGSADKDSVIFDIFTNGKDIYSDKNASFKVDLNQLAINGKYDIKASSLKSHIKLLADMPKMIKGIKLNSDISYNKNSGAGYSGRLDISDVSQAPKELKSLIKGLNLKFDGNQHRLSATLESAKIKGHIVSQDMKKAHLSLGTKGKLRLRYIVNKLPKELKNAWLGVQMNSTVNIKKPLPIKLKVTEKSNIANLDAKIAYNKVPDIDAVVKIPKHSLLNKFDKNLKLSGLSPLKISLKPKNDNLHLKINSTVLNGITDYNIKSKSIKGKIKLSGTLVNIDGKTDKDISLSLNTKSLKNLIKDLSKVYTFKSPNIDGDLNLKLIRQKDGNIKANISSNKFIANTKARVKNPITNIKLSLSADMKQKIFYIDNYSLQASGMKIFATKRSKIAMKKDSVIVDKVWVNDSMSIKGRYNIKKQDGKFDIKSSKFKVVHKNAKIDISTNLKLALNKGKISIGGKVYILGGRVFYNLSSKHYASDEDIVIVQHTKEKNDSFFMKNVKLNILIDSKKDVLFKQKDVKIGLKPSLSIVKEYNSKLMVLGSIDLKKGSYYNFEGKKFVLEKSSIYFTGKPTAPLLNIRLVYRRYGKTIWITVSGTGTEPALNFSSSPYMTRDQILSFILFDTENSGSSTEDMLSLVGGGLAKSILGNMGLKIDTLVLSQNGFEVGKKISNKVSIIYDQEDESKVIVRIEHSAKVETEISVGQDSQSVDIIYKREY